MDQVAVIIPVYNDRDGLKKTLSRLFAALPSVLAQIHHRNLFFSIVLVDDGSAKPLSVETGGFTGSIRGVYLLRHEVNLGQGAALQTGLEFALKRLDCKYFITMDADGQHLPEDLPRLMNAILNGGKDIVFGNRFDKSVKVNPPLSRRLLLKAAVVLERHISGLNLSDAHNGYRAFNRKCAEAVRLEQNRMAHATEFKQIVRRNGLVFGEVPVSIVYSDETLAKGQRNIGSLFILKDLLKAYLFKG